MTFVTDPGRVFTPRATTEQLVDAALERIGDQPARVADIGTGSGVIAVTLALRAPLDRGLGERHLRPRARDRVARTPSGSARSVHLVQGDLLDGLPRDLDLIVANLPVPRARHARATRTSPPPRCSRPGTGSSTTGA